MGFFFRGEGDTVFCGGEKGDGRRRNPKNNEKFVETPLLMKEILTPNSMKGEPTIIGEKSRVFWRESQI